MNNQPPSMHEARHVTLSTHEREQIRDQIVRYMQSHPLPRPASVWADLAQFISGHRLLAACASFVILLAVFSYALEGSEPGGYFYSTKTAIEDSLAGAFMTSPESEMEWDVNTAERRMQEIEQLATDLGW